MKPKDLSITDTTPSLIYEDGELYAFYKPSGMWVHPAQESDGYDLMTWIKDQPDLPSDLTLAHRLDRETSGIVLCTANTDMRREVAFWFQEKQVTKRYFALVYGITRRKGIIRRPLVDRRRGRPLDAVTRYRNKRVLGLFSLLDVRPETGRKHQVRRHLHSIGHPVIGDNRYRPRKRRTIPAFPERLWLHAYSLLLPNGLEITCPLPPALQGHLAHLEQTYLKDRT